MACRAFLKTLPRIPQTLSGGRHFSVQGRLSQTSIPWSQVEDYAGKQPLPLDVLTEDEKLMEDAVTKFATEEIAPLVKDMDRKAEMPDSLIKALFDNGVMSIEIPEQYGGSGSNFFSCALIIQQLARVDPSVATMVDGQNTLGINSFRNWATEKQKEEWYPKFAKDTVISFGLSEPGSGSDAFALASTADKQGDYYVLNGTKCWISSSEEAGLFLIMANASPADGYRGITCFLVEPGTPGFTIGPKEDKLGIRSSSTCTLYFDNCKIHESQMLGKPGDGYKLAISTLNEGRICIAALMTGLSQGCFDYAVQYTRDRKQFGQRIFDFQAMQHQIAHAATQIEASKLLTYNAARRKEIGLPFTKEAAMAKYFASETAQVVCSKSVEWLGGVGFTAEYPIEKFYRDCKIGVIYEGTSNIQLNTIAKLIDKEQAFS